MLKSAVQKRWAKKMEFLDDLLCRVCLKCTFFVWMGQQELSNVFSVFLVLNIFLTKPYHFTIIHREMYNKERFRYITAAIKISVPFLFRHNVIKACKNISILSWDTRHNVYKIITESRQKSVLLFGYITKNKHINIKNCTKTYFIMLFAYYNKPSTLM